MSDGRVFGTPIVFREAQSDLEHDPQVDLFELRINPSQILRLTNHPTVVWWGLTWENFPVELSGLSATTSGEMNRPQFRLGNLGQTLSAAISQGLLYQGSVTRYRVRLQDLHNNQISYVRNYWDISWVQTLTRDYATLELRSPMDRHDYTLPVRQFFPPQFPYVRIS